MSTGAGAADGSGVGGPRARAEPLWGELERYTLGHLHGEDPAGEAVLAGNEAAGIGLGSVSRIEGRLLELLVRVRGARRVLEIGTHGGYSACCMARGMPAGGRVLTLELNPRHAEVARANLAAVGLEERVEVRVGPALASLRALLEEGAAPFDLIFIDADKQSYPEYLSAALALSAPGTAIVADNVIRAGAVLDEAALDPRLGEGGVQALRRFYAQLAETPGLSATAVQTVGAKGHDGFVLAVVTAPA